MNYNRYSYVVNNPLKYTDPSGYVIRPDQIMRYDEDGHNNEREIDSRNDRHWMSDFYSGGGGGSIMDVSAYEWAMISSPTWKYTAGSYLNSLTPYEISNHSKGFRDYVGISPKIYVTKKEHFVTGKGLEPYYNGDYSLIYHVEWNINFNQAALVPAIPLLYELLMASGLFTGTVIISENLNSGEQKPQWNPRNKFQRRVAIIVGTGYVIQNMFGSEAYKRFIKGTLVDERYKLQFVQSELPNDHLMYTDPDYWFNHTTERQRIGYNNEYYRNLIEGIEYE